MEKNTDLQILRAIAVSFVLYDHVRVMLIWGGAYQNAYKYFTFWSGVDIFFAISGFIIAKGLIDSTRTLSFNSYIKSFFIRRFFRIIPSAWLWIMVTLIASYMLGSEFGSLQSNLNDAKSVVLQYANIHFFMCSKSLDVCGVNGRYWSLSLEEQFYLVIPFLIFFIKRNLLIFCLIFIVLSQVFLKRPIWDFMWAIRTDALSLGVIVALIYKGDVYNHLRKKLVGMNKIIKSLVCWAVIVMIPLSPGIFPEKIYLGVVALLSGLIVFISSLDGDSLLKNGFIKRVLVYIGDRSFGIYLIHMPVYLMIRHLFASSHTIAYQSTLIQLPLSIILTLLLSEINYILIERPMINKGKDFINSRVSNLSMQK